MAQCRQAWLRDPDRERDTALVDPRPVEAAVMEAGADTMMDMVRAHVAAATATVRDERLPDEDWLSYDEELLEEGLITPYEFDSALADLPPDEGEFAPTPGPEGQSPSAPGGSLGEPPPPPEAGRRPDSGAPNEGHSTQA